MAMEKTSTGLHASRMKWNWCVHARLAAHLLALLSALALPSSWSLSRMISSQPAQGRAHHPQMHLPCLIVILPSAPQLRITLDSRHTAQLGLNTLSRATGWHKGSLLLTRPPGAACRQCRATQSLAGQL